MRRFLATTVLSLCAAACDGHDHAHESPTANGARVEVLDGDGKVVQAVTITPTSVPASPLVLLRSVPTTLRVTWLDTSGASDPANADADFVVRITPPSGSGISFALNAGSRSTGTMTGSTLRPTAVQVPLSLFHQQENHSDLDLMIPVRVDGPAT